MAHVQRIKDMNMSFTDIAVALSDGNPGAITAIMLCAKEAEKIDPDSVWGPFSSLIAFDSVGIYGSRIWMLFKDVCGQRADTTLGVLRAHQLGILSDDALNAAIDGKHRLYIPGLRKQVTEQLPAFNWEDR